MDNPVAMRLSDVAEMFQRSVRGVLHKRRLFFLFVTLFLCGTVVIFFRGLANIAEGWWGDTLTLFPLFFVLGLILSAQVVLVRLYIHGGGVVKTTWRSLDMMFKMATFSLPLILLFLTLWMVSGIFVLLRSIPYIGPTLGVVLSFAPFLINLAILALALGGTYISFVVCPTVALTGKGVRRRLMNRLKQSLFYDLMLWLVAVLPVWLLTKGLMLASTLTFDLSSGNSLEHLLQAFCVMIPFVALLTPALLFFFNFAAEAARVSDAAQA